MQSEKRRECSRVTVFKTDQDPDIREYTRGNNATRKKHISRMLAKPTTLYVEVTPREYSSNKMRYEAAGGAYDYDKAKQVLGL